MDPFMSIEESEVEEDMADVLVSSYSYESLYPQKIYNLEEVRDSGVAWSAAHLSPAHPPSTPPH
jgi:hypothetical protein